MNNLNKLTKIAYKNYNILIFVILFFSFSCSYNSKKNSSDEDTLNFSFPVKKTYSSGYYASLLDEVNYPFYLLFKITDNNNSPLNIVDNNGNSINLYDQQGNVLGAPIDLYQFYSNNSSDISIKIKYKYKDVSSLNLSGRYMTVGLKQNLQDWCKSTNGDSINNLSNGDANFYYSDLNLKSNLSCETSPYCTASFSMPSASALTLNHFALKITAGVNKTAYFLDGESENVILNPCSGNPFTAIIDSNERLVVDLPVFSSKKVKIKISEKIYSLTNPDISTSKDTSIKKDASTCTQARNSNGIPIFWRLNLASAEATPLNPATDSFLDSGETLDGANTICGRIANNFNPRYKDLPSKYLTPINSYDHNTVITNQIYNLNSDAGTGLQLIDLSYKKTLSNWNFLPDARIMCKVTDAKNNYILGSSTVFSDCTDKIAEPENLNALFISNNTNKMNISYYFADREGYNLYTNNRSLSNGQNPSSQNPINITYNLLVYNPVNKQNGVTSFALSSGFIPSPTYSGIYSGSNINSSAPGVTYDYFGYIQPNITGQIQLKCSSCQTADYYTILGTDISTVGGNSSDPTEMAILNIPNWKNGVSQADLENSWYIFNDFFSQHQFDLFATAPANGASIIIPTYKAPNTAPLVTTLAGYLNTPGNVNGVGKNALFNGLFGGVVDNYANTGNVFIGDTQNQAIRIMTPSGNVSTLTESIGKPSGYLTMDKTSGDLYVSGFGSSIYKYKDNHNGSYTFSVYAGPASTPSNCTNICVNNTNFSNIYGIVLDKYSNLFYFDYGTSTLGEITPNGEVIKILDSSQLAIDGKYSLDYSKSQLVIDSQNNLYLLELNNYDIIKINLNYTNGVANAVGSGSTAVTFVGQKGVQGYADNIDSLGNPTGTAAKFSSMQALAIDNLDNLYVGDNFVVRKVTSTGTVSTIAGTPNTMGYNDNNELGSLAKFALINGLTFDTKNNIIYVNEDYLVRKIDLNKYTKVQNGFSLFQPVSVGGSLPCGQNASSCTYTNQFVNYLSSTPVNFGIQNKYLTFQNHNQPTALSSSGLIYYILLVHVEKNTPAFQIFKVTFSKL